MRENIFELKDVVFGYDKKKEIISSVTAGIPKGEITALIGPNGCGKTTTFGLLSKTFKPWSGSITFCGKSLAEYDRKEYAKKVSVVHQYNTVPDDMSVKNLVALGRTPYHNALFSQENKDDKRIIQEAMEFTGVLEFADRQVRQLSGGQMQRVWLSLALAQSRETLLLDEITTYLDIRYQYDILNLIKDLNKTFGTTVVMVLHDINQTMQFSHNTIIMKGGEIVCQGATDEVITENIIKDTYGIDASIEKVGESKICLFNKVKDKSDTDIASADIGEVRDKQDEVRHTKAELTADEDTAEQGKIQQAKVRKSQVQQTEVQKDKIQKGKVQNGEVQKGKVQNGKVQNGKGKTNK